MKPRYSIATIAILTAYAAVLAAAIADPFSVWQTLGMFAPIPILGVCCRVVLTTPGPRRWFAAGMIVGTLAYAAAIIIPHGSGNLPHEWAADAVWGHPADAGDALHEVIYGHALLAFQFALLCGVATGCLMLVIRARHWKKTPPDFCLRGP